MVANGRHRKIIFSLDDGNSKVEGHENLKCYVTMFYKDLFGELEESDITLDESNN